MNYLFIVLTCCCFFFFCQNLIPSELFSSVISSETICRPKWCIVLVIRDYRDRVDKWTHFKPPDPRWIPLYRFLAPSWRKSVSAPLPVAAILFTHTRPVIHQAAPPSHLKKSSITLFSQLPAAYIGLSEREREKRVEFIKRLLPLSKFCTPTKCWKRLTSSNALKLLNHRLCGNLWPCAPFWPSSSR